MDACEAVGEVPETLQVAWVSPVGMTVGAGAPLQVVRVADLRRFAEGKESLAVLQALGLAGRKDQRAWKVTVFDVKREWLCRPAEWEPGTDLSGVAACESGWQAPGRGTKARSYSGCGYLLDTQSEARTLDVYRVDWETAVSWGFCVLPWERFLGGT